MKTNNHQAHGPVSLERLHQISEILSKAAAQSDGGNLGYAMSDAVKLINGAIAAFGAEPVPYAAEETMAYAKAGELHLKCLSQPMGDAVIPLYTAPPAPVVNEFIPKNLDRALGVVGVALPESKEEFNFQTERWIQRLIDRVISYSDEFCEQPALVVPDELLSSMEEVLRISDRDHEAWHKVRNGIAHFRAAMLQAGNSPVTTDAWIPVSERMPERDVDVQVYCADKKEQMVGYMERNETEGWFRFASLPNGCGVYCKPTHWMPLPAAPQHEVK